MYWLSQLPWDTLPLPAPPCVQSAKPIFSLRSVSSRPWVSPERRGCLAARVLSPKIASSQVSREQQYLRGSHPHGGPTSWPAAPSFHLPPPERHSSSAEATTESTLRSAVSLSLPLKVRQFGASPGPKEELANEPGAS